MNKNDFDYKYCSKNVKTFKLRDLLNYFQPYKHIVKSTHYDNSYPTPVLTPCRDLILGYTNEKNGIYYANKENPVIIFDDFRNNFNYVDFNFKVKNSAMKILTSKNEVNLKYIYYAMKQLKYKHLVPGACVRQWISTYSNLQIALPSLEAQKNIVKILDTFTEIKMNLETEYKARQQQQNVFIEKLICENNEKFPKMYLKDLAKLIIGKNYKTLNAGDIPVYTSAGIKAYVDKYSYNKPSVLIPRKGSIEKLFYEEKPFWHTDLVYNLELDTTKMIPKFLYYFLKSVDFMSFNRCASSPSLTKKIIGNTLIPVPSLNEQEHIVSILDNTDLLINKFEGIPAEISARSQQFEQYADKLLTFKMN